MKLINSNMMRQVVILLMVGGLGAYDTVGQVRRTNEKEAERMPRTAVRESQTVEHADSVSDEDGRESDHSRSKGEITARFITVPVAENDKTTPLFNSRGEVIGSYRRYASGFKDVESFKGEVTIGATSFPVTSFQNAFISADDKNIILYGDLTDNHRGGAMQVEVYTISGVSVSPLKTICEFGCKNIISTTDGHIYYAGKINHNDRSACIVKARMNGDIVWQKEMPSNVWITGWMQLSPAYNHILISASTYTGEGQLLLYSIQNEKYTAFDPNFFSENLFFINENSIVTTHGSEWSVVSLIPSISEVKSGSLLNNKTAFIKSQRIFDEREENLVTFKFQSHEVEAKSFQLCVLDIKNGKESCYEFTDIEIPSGYRRCAQFSDHVFRCYSNSGILEITMK